MWNKSKQPQQSRVEKRVASIPTDDLVSWSEQALFGIGRHLTSWQKNRNIQDLDEAEVAAEALYAVVRELKKRTGI
jgi:hypothetical protein